ncbi:MAG TPA: FlgD immunoglobulin-like domain containing protein, partial [Spirochaetia bacterium]|nr:FlgD immunoglobulin-like domain containing protein [Spirochaetia bacterium]
AQSVVLTPQPGRIDVALLGRGAGLYGSGELVQARFRVVGAGDAALTLKSVEARDAANKKVTLGALAGVGTGVPTATSLARAMPNPFTGTTTLSFGLAQGGAVELAVFGVDGRKVTTLATGRREAGQYLVSWDGRDGNGQAVRPGMYYARLTTPQGRFTRTLVLMK